MAETYQGWTNYETWVVKLWIDNEEPSYRYWLATAGEVWDESEEDHPLTRSEVARHSLADKLKDEIEEGIPEINGLYADLLSAAISDVNWGEIADSLLQECDGYESL